METAIYRYRREAYIRISPDLEIDKEYERLIVHELLHLIVDPISEKYEFVLDHLQTGRGMASNAKSTLRDQYTLEMERTVEHLSHVLYDK